MRYFDQHLAICESFLQKGKGGVERTPPLK